MTAIETFPLESGVTATDITAGPDGNVWFTEENEGRIGRITTPPNATTGGISGVGAAVATAAGTVNGHSQPTDVAIEYEPAGGAAATSPGTHLPAGAADQPVSIPISGLAPSTEYRYRVVATNPTGTTKGAFAAFRTGPAPQCRVTRTRSGHKGVIRLTLSCEATDSITARATFKVTGGLGKESGVSRKQTRRILYGTARARVVKGKATVRIKPRKSARAQLRRRGSLRVKIAMRLHGGGATTALNRPARAKR